MKRVTLLFVLLAAVLAAASAPAATSGLTMSRFARMARANVTVPTAWDGVWTTLDSTYSCTGTFETTDTYADTICGGQNYAPDAQGSGFSFNCTGTATASAIDWTCTGTSNVADSCDVHYTMVIHGTLTGSSYHMVQTFTISYVGTSLVCNMLPSSCSQIDTWGTRTGPAPAEYCSTPTRSTTWGRLKSLYR